MSEAIIEQVAPKRKPNKITFDKLTPDSFQADVKKRVDDYFKSNGISKYANGRMKFKTFLIILTWASTYGLILSGIIPPIGMLGLALLHGFTAAMIGLNIAHDAIHGSFSPKGIVNKAGGVLFNIIGANDYMWSITHNVVHHN